MSKMPKLPSNFNVKESLAGRKGKGVESLEGAIERFLRHSSIKNLKETTVNNYKYQLDSFLQVAIEEEMPIDNVRDLTTTHSKLYKLRLLERGLSYNSINTYTLALNIFWRFLQKKGFVDENIFADMHLRVTQSPKFTPNKTQWTNTFKHQLKRAESDFIQYRNLVIFVFLSDTGARVNECIHVKREDINISEKGKEFVILNDTKNGEPRRIGLSAQLINLLRDYMEMTENIPCEYLFFSQRHKMISKRQVQHFIKELGRASGIPELSCHSLRRFFISKHVNNGTPLPVLQRLVGHKDISMVSHYYAMFSDDFLKYKDIEV